MREMILADSQEKRKAFLAKLLPFQKEDFKGIFEVMAGLTRYYQTTGSSIA